MKFVIFAAVLIAFVAFSNAQGCPELDGEFAVNIPHESDCTLFYKCFRGVPILQECPPSGRGDERLHFNAALSVCDWPEQAGCA